MRILYVVHQFPPDRIGGTEVYTLNLSRELVRLGHRVAVFHRAPGAQGLVRAEGEGVRVYRVHVGRMTPWPVFRAAFGHRGLERAFSETLMDFQPELVHLQHLMGLPISIVTQAQSLHIPLVLTLHDYWFTCANAQLLTNYDQTLCQGPSRWGINCARCALSKISHRGFWLAFPALMALLAWRNRSLRRVLMEPNVCIAPTEFVRDWYVTHGVPADKLLVIPHGIEHTLSEPRRGWRADAPLRFAYIGGLSWQKGVHVVVEAFSRARGLGELLVAGDASIDSAYVSRLRAHASSNVHFMGRLTREEVWSTLAQVDAVVVPSLWYETFSLVVHEAFTAGVPVIASRLGALREKVRHGVNGLLISPGDVEAWRETLEQLMAEPSLLAHLKMNVRPPMTMRKHASRLESLYRQLVARSPRTLR